MLKNLPARLREKCVFEADAVEFHMRRWFQEQVDDNPNGGSATIAQLTGESARWQHARLVPILERLISLAELVLAEECPITQSTAYVKCKCLRCGRLNALRDCLGEE